ncbi:MAG TPA: metal ABC transporter substrate-binding protein [Candidatus Lokiarchaeia archaeon]|nr:metal ABC transporter substrate-binding protein [Candidatus Lokiarchaeia archaeon]
MKTRIIVPAIVMIGFLLVFSPSSTMQHNVLITHKDVNTTSIPKQSTMTPLKIITTVSVAWDIARNIAGNLATVESLVPGGTDIHTYSGPTSAQMQDLMGADLLVNMGILDLEPWLAQTMASLGSSAPKSLSIAQPSMLKIDPDLDNATNPHVWMDPNNVKVMASEITQELCTISPSNNATFKTNNATYQASLDALLVSIQGNKTMYNGMKVVSRHASFSYFFWLLGINQRAIIEKVEGQEPSQTWINQVVQMMVAEHITVFIGQPQISQQEIYSIANDAGAQVAWLSDMPGLTMPDNTAIDSYIGMMYYNMYALSHPVDPSPAQLDPAMILVLIILSACFASVTIVAVVYQKRSFASRFKN